MTKLVSFCIVIKRDITNQMIQDAFDKCADNGIVAFDSILNSEKRHVYKRAYNSNFKYFGVSRGRTYLHDHIANFGADAIEITLDQLDEHLGIAKPEPEPESDYDKGMREAMQKIAVSCGKQFGVDIGYETLPDLVESLVNPKQEPKEPKFKYESLNRAELSIWEIMKEYQDSDGKLFYKPNADIDKYAVIIEWFNVAELLRNGDPVYRRVERTEEEDLLDFLADFEKDFIKLSDKRLKTALDKFRNAKLD